jgi:hypothetical protein
VWNGKRTDALELPRSLRVDADMGATVRNLAMANRHSIGQQLLVLIEAGINVETGGLRRKSQSVTELARKARRSA